MTVNFTKEEVDFIKCAMSTLYESDSSSEGYEEYSRLEKSIYEKADKALMKESLRNVTKRLNKIFKY